jgi:hypothetical protein
VLLPRSLANRTSPSGSFRPGRCLSPSAS